MSGTVTADHFTLDRNGTVVKSELLGSATCVHDDELKTLASDALRIEQHVGTPVDCEWAIDRRGHHRLAAGTADHHVARGSA